MTLDSSDSPMHQTAVGAEQHGSGSMGSRPSQAIFVGWLAVGLLAFMLAATAIVMLAALTYGS